MQLKTAAAAFVLIALSAGANAQPTTTAAPSAQAPVIAPAPAPSAQPQQSTPPVALTPLQGPDRDAALARANAALNGVTRLQGHFIQIASNGSRTTGAFYMQRPGKLRFEYDPPASRLIISDGSVVALRDVALRTTDRTPLRSTPLNLVLRGQVDLAHDARITRVARGGDWIEITCRDRGGHTDGEITLQFQGAELRSWDLSDATGARTHIALTDLSQPASLDPHLFQMPSINENRPGPH